MVIRVKKQTYKQLMFSTMKKTYIIPTVEVLNIAPATLIAESIGKDPEPGDPSQWDVKEDRTSRGTHDVWDDDWSR